MRNEMAAAARNLWGYTLVTLRDRPELLDEAAAWFHEKWGVPEAAYRERMADYLSGGTEYGWYLCLNSGRIVGGLGVIDNDFHDRPDLTPNVCAVYTDEAYRGRGIAGALLGMAVDGMPCTEETLDSLWHIAHIPQGKLTEDTQLQPDVERARRVRALFGGGE